MSQARHDVSDPSDDDGRQVSDPNARIVGQSAIELRHAFVERLSMLRHAPTYRDDQGVLDVSAGFVELPDGRFVPRE